MLSVEWQLKVRVFCCAQDVSAALKVLLQGCQRFLPLNSDTGPSYPGMTWAPSQGHPRRLHMVGLGERMAPAHSMLGCNQHESILSLLPSKSDFMP